MNSLKVWWTTSLLVIYCTSVALATCSNSTHQCFKNLTCCGVSGNAALCCPYNNGVCCTNGLHCCPENSQCHADKGLCVPKTKLGIPFLKDLYSVVPLHQQGPKHRPKLEICPSKRMMCPSKTTCCPGPYVGFDCCPMSLGVCCEDFQHCCPFNTSCDTKRKQCISHEGQAFPWYKKLKAEIINLSRIKKVQLIKSNLHQHITCLDGKAKCKNHQTCCSLSAQEHSCCDLFNAKCCADGTHCCPQGTECDTFTKTPTCIKGKGYRVEAFPLHKTLTNSQNHTLKENDNKIGADELLTATTNATATIICPGGKYSCPEYMTCCPSSKGKYGCCPFPNAVCCSDNWHCCPGGSSCDLQHDRCIRGGLFTPLFTKAKANTVGMLNIEINHNCPDKSECPDSSTCCQLPSMKYGCCPLPDAVCCTDHLHCCPHGTVCDLVHQGCKPGNAVNLNYFHKIHSKWTKNTLNIEKNIGVSICPGGFFECPDNMTCCHLQEGWACCPFNKGVCCKDKKHCCPNGYMCDLEAGRCINGNITINF